MSRCRRGGSRSCRIPRASLIRRRGFNFISLQLAYHLIATGAIKTKGNLSAVDAEEMSRLSVNVVVLMVVGALVTVAMLAEPAEATCESNRLRQGCRIQEGGCLCGTGCDTDYRYSNKLECDSALRGRSRDPCNPNPCLHRGTCLQVLNGFNCLCTGTNYYGDRCEQRCPRRSALRRGQNMPVQCIVI